MKIKDAQGRQHLPLVLFLLIDQESQRLRLKPALQILSGRVKCFLLDVCISVLASSI